MTREPFFLSRRAFLRGAGASLALPFLESLAPRGLRAALAATPPPRRLLVFYLPDGFNMAAYRPVGQGAGYTLSPTLSPLQPFQDRLLVISGLANRIAQPDSAGGDHAMGTASILTCQHPVKTEGADIMNGVSMDQVAAATLGAGTQFPSLQLGCEGGAGFGSCDNGYSCTYERNISWAGPAQPLPKLVDPQTVFDRFFGGSDPSATAAQVMRRRAAKTSVLDYLTAQSTALRARLGTSDQRKLDEYTSGVRALEKRLAAQAGAPVCDGGSRPIAPVDLRESLEIMSDLIAIAWKCDLTRVATFMFGNGGSNLYYPWLQGVMGAHHDLSHHMGDPYKLGQLAIIDQWEMTLLATLLGKLDAIVESDGRTALDHSLVLMVNEVSDGNQHLHYDLPVLVAGTAGGALKTTGQHLALSSEQPIASLYTSVLNLLGVPVKGFGAHNDGPLAGLS